MIFEYNDSDIHSRYDLGRGLSPHSTDSLMELLARYVARPVTQIVDLGCGTGRFTVALSKTFDAPVIGVEPALNMRSTAEAKPHPTAVRFVHGSANNIPLAEGAADLVFMSQVFHHLIHPDAAFREIRRVLAPRGHLCLRQTTTENLDSYFYQRFFPEARAVDERRLPSRDSLMHFSRSCGYRVERATADGLLAVHGPQVLTSPVLPIKDVLSYPGIKDNLSFYHPDRLFPNTSR